MSAARGPAGQCAPATSTTFQVTVKVVAEVTIPIHAANEEEAERRAHQLAITEAAGHVRQAWVDCSAGGSIEVLGVKEDFAVARSTDDC